MQLTPDIFTLLKEYGISTLFMITILYFFYKAAVSYFIKTIQKFIDQHEEAIKKIAVIEKNFSSLCDKLSGISNELNKRCNMEQCRYLDEISDIISDSNKLIHQFVEEAKVGREENRAKINDIVVKIEEANKDTKEISQSLLGLVRSFWDKKVNE